MYLAQNLKYLREQRKMTQKEMAEILEYSSCQGYSAIETGKVTPNVNILEKLSNFFEVTLDQMVRQDLTAINEQIQSLATGVITTPKKYYCDAEDIMNCLGCKENKAYKVMRVLRKELIDAGKLTPAYPPGKIPKKYFIERCMVEE